MCWIFCAARGIEAPSVLAALERMADELEAGAFRVDEIGEISRDDAYTVARFADELDRRHVAPDAPERVGLRRLLTWFQEHDPEEIVGMTMASAFEAHMESPSDELFDQIAEMLREAAEKD